MSRLIDANNIKEAKFNNVPCVKTTPTDSELESYMRGWNDAIDAIAECEPTVDAVEVIRCSQCARHEVLPNAVDICKKLKIVVNEKHYCGYAERREDEQSIRNT